MLPVVGWDEKIVLFQASGRPHIPEIKHWNKTLKRPETVLAFAHDETKIKQNIHKYIHTYSFITQNDRTHLHKIKIQVKKYE